jgi:hypothetical protein
VSESTVKNVLRNKKAASERLAEVAQGTASAAEILKQEVPATKQNKVKVPTAQPAPKRLRPGSRNWVEQQVQAITNPVFALRRVYPKLSDDQRERILRAREVLGHVERIGFNSDQFRQLALGLVEVWNKYGKCQIEVDDERLLQAAMEAIACTGELYLDRWVRVIEKIAKDPSWLTDNNFYRLVSTRDGRPVGLEDLEKQEGLPAWGPAASESVEEVAR